MHGADNIAIRINMSTLKRYGNGRAVTIKLPFIRILHIIHRLIRKCASRPFPGFHAMLGLQDI